MLPRDKKTLADRRKEIELVNRRASDIKQGLSVKECIITFHGIFGIGKTALLQSLHDYYKQDTEFATVLLDLSSVTPHTHMNMAKLYVLEELAQVSLVSVMQDIEQIKAHFSRQEFHDDYVKPLTVELSDVQRPVVLFIDGWQDIPDIFSRWLEQELLLPLVRTEKAMIVLGSQKILRWKHFEVRSRVGNWELSPLALEDTRQQIGERNASLSNLVFSITAGHPWANSLVMQHLPAEQSASAWLEQNQAVVAVRVRDELQERIIQGKPNREEFQQVFNILSIFREFDVNTLRVILSQFLDAFKHSSPAALRVYTRHLQETQVVEWNNERRAWQIDKTLRYIFAQAVRLGNPQRFLAIKQAAIKYYELQVSENHNSRNIYLIEYYYHLLSCKTPQENTREEIRNLLEEPLYNHYVNLDNAYIALDKLRELGNMIAKDTELHDVLDEQQLPQKFLETIINDFASSVSPV
jgi:hypothetical protein